MREAATRTVLSSSADRVMRYGRVVFTVLAVISALTVLAAIVLQQLDPDLVNWVVWVRSAFYTVGGLWLLALVRKARLRADRPSFVRLRAVCVLAPLGIAALVISPDSGYPVWMKVEQAVCGLLLAPLAVALLRPSLSREFPSPQAHP